MGLLVLPVLERHPIHHFLLVLVDLLRLLHQLLRHFLPVPVDLLNLLVLELLEGLVHRHFLLVLVDLLVPADRVLSCQMFLHTAHKVRSSAGLFPLLHNLFHPLHQQPFQ